MYKVVKPLYSLATEPYSATALLGQICMYVPCRVPQDAAQHTYVG